MRNLGLVKERDITTIGGNRKALTRLCLNKVAWERKSPGT